MELTLGNVLGSLRALGMEEYGGDVCPLGSTVVAMDVPLTNLGDSSAQMTLLF
jgi:hypothetical protein